MLLRDLLVQYVVDFLIAEHEKSGWCGSSLVTRELPEEFGSDFLLSISHISAQSQRPDKPQRK